VASLIAIVIGGYQFALEEPGAKRALAGVAAGTGIAILATNVLTWLWDSKPKQQLCSQKWAREA
jgi:type IV secretion system protein VirB2